MSWIYRTIGGFPQFLCHRVYLLKKAVSTPQFVPTFPLALADDMEFQVEPANMLDLRQNLRPCEDSWEAA